jgi:4-amino-4-deoxy-L-arabinose transferase-like glycosyltransferase
LDKLAAWFPLFLLALTLVQFWPNLDHPSLGRDDEVIHQVVTRQFHDTGVPMVFAEPLVPYPIEKWEQAHIFLHKPPLPFALGALLMSILGVTPLALRLVSLAAAFAASVGLYLFGRRVIGSLLAAFLAAAFLCLPFGFTLVQGYQWGDVTDCSLLGFVTLSIWLLSIAVERDSTRFAAAAGALLGCAYLCKSALALVPLGVAGGLAVLGQIGLAPRIRIRLVLVFAAAAIVVALPWNLYQAIRWPELYWFEAKHTLGFLWQKTRPWARPIDAVFNEINELELTPWPVAVFPIAGLWLLWVTAKRRTADLWILCLWLWGEWIPLSLTLVKVPAHTWAAAPAALLAVGALLCDAFERPWLACVGLGALGTSLAPNLLKTLSIFRKAVPPGLLKQTATRPGLAEGIVLALILGAIGVGLTRLFARKPGALRFLGGITLAVAAWIGLVQSAQAMRQVQEANRDAAVDSYGDVLGRVLDRALPDNAVLFLSTRDSKCCVGREALMFYSGRAAYPAQEKLVELAEANGLHPYLVSGLAQPFQRVEGVPAGAWLQAYDLDAPQVVPDAALPEGAIPADATIGSAHVLGVATAHGDSDRDRYVFFLRQSGDFFAPLDVSFTLDDGSVEHEPIAQRRALDWPISAKSKRPTPPNAERSWLTDPSATNWYTLSVPGPLRSRLKSLRLSDAGLLFPVADDVLIYR